MVYAVKDNNEFYTNSIMTKPILYGILLKQGKVERVSAERSVKMIKTMNFNHIMNNGQLSLALDYFQGLVLTYTFKTERKRKL